MKVLVIEDDPIMQTTLAGNLESWGYEPVMASDGEKALNLLQLADAPQMLILDWALPGMSGIQLCRRLKQKQSKEHYYIIMLTGRINTEDLVAGFEAGADDYVVKPFKGLELKARIQAGERTLKMLWQYQQQKNKNQQEQLPALSLETLETFEKANIRILIAEDDPISRTVLEENLNQWGYEVVSVENGEDAWGILQGDNPPQVAILDWMMPKMNGIDVCKLARKTPSGQSIYILLLTAKGQTEDVVNGFKSGADDYLTKPFPAAELRARVRDSGDTTLNY